MPNIRELGPGNIPGVGSTTGLRPSEAGPNAERQLGATLRSNAAESGRVIGESISRIGPIIQKSQDAAAQNEISTGTASYAQSVFTQSQNWDNLASSADPQDMSVGQKAIDSNNEYWDNWANNFHTPKGQAWAAAKAAEAKTSFQKSVIADNSTRAGYAAQANLKTYMDATVAHAGSNPEQLDSILAAIPNEIGGTVPEGANAKVRTKAIADGTQQVQSAAVREAITKRAAVDPNFDTEWPALLAKYGQYLTPSEQDSLPQIADRAATARDRAANAKATAQDKAQRSAIDSATVETYQGLHNPDGSINYNAVADAHKNLAPGGKLSSMPGFTKTDYTEVQNYLDKLESGASKLAKDDPTVKEDLQTRMSSTDNPISEADIYRAEVNGHITASTRAALVGEWNVLHPKNGSAGPLDNAVVKQEYEAGLARMDPSKNQDNYFIGPDGKELKDDELAKNQGITQAYKDWYMSTFLLGIQAGKKPEQLVDPSSPDAIWKHWIGPDPYGKINAPGVAPFNYGAAPIPSPSAQPPKPGATPPANRPSLDALWGAK